METIEKIYNAISEQMLPILGEDWFANIISFIGAGLGTIAFFMQLPKRIKPIILHNGDVEFEIEEKENGIHKWVNLIAVNLSITIVNLKNAYGLVEDIFLRIYTSDSFTPDIVLYFPTKKINETPRSRAARYQRSPSPNRPNCLLS